MDEGTLLCGPQPGDELFCCSRVGPQDEVVPQHGRVVQQAGPGGGEERADRGVIELFVCIARVDEGLYAVDQLGVVVWADVDRAEGFSAFELGVGSFAGAAYRSVRRIDLD